MRKRILELPLGTRFKYIGKQRVYVLLNRADEGLVADWQGVDTSVALQGIYSLGSRREIETLEVEVVE